MNKLIVALVLYLVFIATIVWFPPFYTNAYFLNNLIYSTFSLIATIAGINALKTLGIKGARSQAVLFIVFGIGVWFIADVLWAAELIIRGEAAYPALGDYLYLLGYIALFIGLIKEVLLARISINKINVFLIGMITFFSLVGVGGFAYFLVYLAYNPDAPLLENIVSMGYGTGDIILILVNVFLLLLMWEYRGGKIARTWLFLLIGFLSTIIGDSLYAYFTTEYEANINPVTNITNLFYYGGYIFITIYFLKLREFIRDLQMKALPKN